MTDPARIVLDPTILVGKPVILGTRLAVDFIVGLMAGMRPIFCAIIEAFRTTTLRLASPTLATR